MKKGSKEVFRNWFTNLLAILRKDLISTRRVKKYFFSAIIPPLVILIVFTSFSQISNPETYTVMVIDDDNTNLSGIMVDYIGNISSDFAPWFNVVHVDSLNESLYLLNDYRYLGLIHIPSGFESNITSGISGQKGIIILIVQNINDDYVKNFMQRLDEAVLTFNQDLHLSPGSVDDFKINLDMNYIIDQPVSILKMIVLGVLSIYGIICGLLFGALNIAKEYEDLTIIEIANSPVSRTAYLVSKQLIAVFLGGIIMIIFSILMFFFSQIQFRGNYLIIILAFVLSTWIHSGIGCLIGLKLKKTMPVILTCIISSMLLWFFSGGFAPLMILGDTVVFVSRFLPSSYWTEILVGETLFPTITYILPRILTLAIISVFITIISWYLISKEGFKE
jgi:ABC-type multidrug transport system permease subunit